MRAQGGVDLLGGVFLHARHNVTIDIKRYAHRGMAGALACDLGVNAGSEKV